MDLLKNLKKDYVESNSLLPIDEIKEGLVVLTLDPERVKSQRIANTIFPKHKIIYAVTTKREFNATVEQFYGCLLYTSDAADERSSVDLGGRRIIQKKKNRTGAET